MHVVALGVLAVVSVTLHGCGGGGDSPPAPAPPAPPSPPPPSPPGPLVPLKAISYHALPDRDWKEGDPEMSPDMVQQGYESQWGPSGRDDLGMIKALGSNAIRTYHSLGIESAHDHGKFLDKAYDYGLHVLPGYHTQMVCNNFDCFDSWKAATLAAFKVGFQKNKSWHPAVGMLVLAEQPDNINFEGSTPDMCKDKPTNKCWVRAMLSMIDGVLAAEKEAGIVNSTVNLTAAWSMDTKATIDGRIGDAVGYFGWYDLQKGVEDPDIADYTPRTGSAQLKAAHANRWVNALNMGMTTDWSFISGKILPIYGTYFKTTPWFISGFGTNDKGPGETTSDLEDMLSETTRNQFFLGASVNSFQRQYNIPGLVDGLFDLGTSDAQWHTGEVCKEDVRTHSPVCESKLDVDCLTDKHGRAKAVAAAWNGAVKGVGLCQTTDTKESTFLGLSSKHEVVV